MKRRDDDLIIAGWLVPVLLTVVLALSGGILGELFTVSSQHAELRAQVSQLEYEVSQLTTALISRGIVQSH